MGKSRSVTILTAYLCSLTSLSWTTVLNAIREVRPVADPNPGFKEQLKEYEENGSFKNWDYFPEGGPKITNV